MTVGRSQFCVKDPRRIFSSRLSVSVRCLAQACNCAQNSGGLDGLAAARLTAMATYEKHFDSALRAAYEAAERYINQLGWQTSGANRESRGVAQ